MKKPINLSEKNLKFLQDVFKDNLCKHLIKEAAPGTLLFRIKTTNVGTFELRLFLARRNWFTCVTANSDGTMLIQHWPFVKPILLI